MDLPPLRMIVPGLLPEGTTLLVAPPKVGKSCLVYQVAIEVSLGGELFGERVASGSALYLALEDGMRRGQDRLRDALAGRTLPRGRLEVRWSAPASAKAWKSDAGRLGRRAPRRRARRHRHARAGATPRDGNRRTPTTSTWTSSAGCNPSSATGLWPLVLVHHLNKGSSDDFVAQVSGTYGVSGSVDTIININRKRLEAFGTITVTGRDVADAQARRPLR